MQWYYSKNDAPCGPVDDTELKRLIRADEITRETLIWNSTMGEEWKPASTFGFLFFPPVDLQPPSIPDEVESASVTPSEGTTPNRYLVSRARTSLKGHWGMTVGAMLIYVGLFFLTMALYEVIEIPAHIHANQVAYQTASIAHGARPTTVELPLHIQITGYVIQLLQLLITGPVTVGLCIFILKIAHRSEAKVMDIFKGFTLFWKAVGTYLFMMLLMLLWGSLFMLPAIAFLIWKKIDVFHGEHPNSPIFVLLCIAAFILLMIKMLSYAMTFFVLADDPTVGPLLAIRKSTIMMSGRKWKYICLQFRFIGWWILSLLTCYIGLLWLIPYMATAKAHFYLDVKDRADLPKV